MAAGSALPTSNIAMNGSAAQEDNEADSDGLLVGLQQDGEEYQVPWIRTLLLPRWCMMPMLSFIDIVQNDIVLSIV